MMKKLLSVLLVFVLAFTGIVIKDVSAQPFIVADVDINGRDIDNLAYLYVDRGETIDIMVEVAGDDAFWEDIANGLDIENDRIEGITVEAEILGYKYNRISDTSGRFIIEYQGTNFENLKLKIPEDMDLIDNKYTLRVRAYNQQYSVSFAELPLRVRAEEDLLNIMRVDFTPGLTLEVNQPLFATVRVENMGYNKAENIVVSLSVPQLGRESFTDINELSPADVAENDDQDIENSESTESIYLDLRGAQPGTYNLIVKVEYDRGHKEVTENYQLVINGLRTSELENVLMIDSVEKTKSVDAEQGAVYIISIVNLGTGSKVFTADVTGLDWGNYRIDPMPVVVQGGSSADMFLYVSPKEDALGQKTFTVNVKEGNNIVKQITFQANIAESKGEWDNVLTGLEIGFIVLLIILVILGIILAATRMNKKGEGNEALGESYY